MDCPSGASMYVTRACLEKIGPIDERFFLFCEDLDWGVRARSCGLGYASASIVAHKRGATTGSARSLVTIPRLSVYLQHRNDIHFVRKHFPWTLSISVVVLFLYAVQYLIGGSPNNFKSSASRNVGRA
jgi:GT2 family glycosyltransferase